MKKVLCSLLIPFFLIGINTFTQNSKQQLRQISDAFTTAAEKVRPTVVNISTETEVVVTGRMPFFDDELFRFFFGDRDYEPQKRSVTSLGSGIIISEDGYILTNNHVVKGATKITVSLLDGRTFDAEIKGNDQMTDIALLKINGKGLPHALFGDSDNLKIAEWVIAIGNPYGFNFSVTSGIVSALPREMDFENPLLGMIQTDAAINKGNSGGPLINLDGEVIGINTAIVSNMGGGFQGLGFAVPINTAKRILPQLKKDGVVKRGYIGIFPQELDDNLKKAFNFKGDSGILIRDVIAGGPAEKAGLKNGDIITKVNNENINGVNDLIIKISSIDPGKRVRITYFREGRARTADIVLEERPEDRVQVTRKIQPAEDKIGLKVQSLTEALRSNHRIPKDVQGVIVVGVQSSKFAEKAGIEIGDVILSMNNLKILTMDDYIEAVSKANTKSGILFYLFRKGQRIYTYYSE